MEEILMKAPEFPNGLRWFNSPPLHLADLKKKVVLVDFWTYSCVNCIRTLPHVKEWYEKYAALGLAVVGVHTPEFEFEKELANVERAVKQFGISYPVVMDSDYELWSRWSVNAWPWKFLIGKDGQMVYNHAGEGGYRETEEAIQKALLEIKPKAKLPPLADLESGTGGVCYPTTPETYLGSLRGRPGRVWDAQGDWKMHSEFIEHMEHSESFKDCLALRFEASEVNIVMESKGERPAKVRLEINGELKREFEVRDAKMYVLLSGSEMMKGELKLYVKDSGIRAYAFTFGGCAIPGVGIKN